MADLKGKKQKQPSSCPDGWLTAALVVQLELTHRQEKYARRAVGIARFVYNRTVANDQAARDTGLWLTPHELEKEFNSVKQTNSSLAFTTQVSKFVAQGACRNAHSRWRNKQLKSRKPTFHKKRLTGTGSFLAASGVNLIRYDGHRRIRLPYLGSVKMTCELRDGIPYEVTIRKAQRTLVRQRRLLETAHTDPRPSNTIGRRRRRGHQPTGGRQRQRHLRQPTRLLPGTAPPETLAKGTGHRHAASKAAGAGGKHNAVSTVLTAKPRDCGAMRTIRSAEPWSADTTPWASNP